MKEMNDFKIRFLAYPFDVNKIDFKKYVISVPQLVDLRKIDMDNRRQVNMFLDEVFKRLMPEEYEKVTDLYNGIMSNKDKPLPVSVGSLSVDLDSITDDEIEKLTSLLKPSNVYTFYISIDVEKELNREDIEEIVDIAGKYDVPLKPYVAVLGKEIDSMAKFTELQKLASKKSWAKVVEGLRHQ